MPTGHLIFASPVEGAQIAFETDAMHFRNTNDAEAAHDALKRGRTVVVGARRLTAGWSAPPGTLTTFTPDFLDFYGSDSDEFRQARARAVEARQ